MKSGTLLVCLYLVFSAPFPQAQTRRALLIGINLYQPPHTSAKRPAGCTGGRCELTEYPNLNGSLNDVAAMRDLLASPKFGFAPADIAVLTNPGLSKSSLPFVVLPASQTTHDGLLAAMRKYLVDLPQREDTVVFYYAGHGSLRVNSLGTKLTIALPDGKLTHANSTLVPADAWSGAYDVLDLETTKIFNAALDKGIHLTVILDSCHSGAFSRGIRFGRQPRSRMLDYDPRDIAEAPPISNTGEKVKTPAERGALIYSAAQQDQTAKESPPPDSVPEPHGAFTAALIRSLEALPPDAPVSLVDQQVRAALEGANIPDQMPSLDANADRRSQPLFGGASGTRGKLRAVAVGSDGEGNVVLDVGRLAGIGPGSTFSGTDAKGRRMLLKVKELDGITRSKAAVLSPPGDEVSTAEPFVLEKWVPAPIDPLHVWTWPATLSLEQIQNAAEAIRAAGIQSVEDPASMPWTDLLSWNGTAWVLQHAGSSNSATLGAELTADVLRQQVPSGVKVWVNLPPPRELAATLDLHTPTSLVQGVDEVANADYILTGSLTSDGPSWAWFRHAEFEAGPSSGKQKTSPGCSATSHYPVRSDWVLISSASDAADAGAALNTYSLRLAKLNGWLHLPPSPGGASDDYYHLAFARGSGNEPLKDGEAVTPADHPQLMLVSDSRVIQKRWVYVLDVDCRGKGTLLYPGDYSENEFPKEGSDLRRFLLPGAQKINVNPPFGLDTIFLITTTEPLPDPWSLSFEGVSTRGIKRSSVPPTPLQQLLSNISSGTRGLTPAMPTDWSITVGGLESVPGETQ
ncbi:MAG TPA: caspase family protein [Acidobacteriaceae bacterium]|nr:caspase family protein [Acidobacteriaceae bacterium]